jgi:hypothetical protein
MEDNSHLMSGTWQTHKVLLLHYFDVTFGCQWWDWVNRLPVLRYTTWLTIQDVWKNVVKFNGNSLLFGYLLGSAHILFDTLLVKDEYKDDKVWNNSMSHGTCIGFIADHVGADHVHADNVGDIAGLGSDPCDSYAESSGAALGMLSSIAIGLAIDAYVPISEHIGGIVEMVGMSHRILARTNALVAAGHTTDAIGKGFAMGSAALVYMSLFGVFVSCAEISPIAVLMPKVCIGLIVSAMLPFLFSALDMKTVGSAALKDGCGSLEIVQHHAWTHGGHHKA